MVDGRLNIMLDSTATQAARYAHQILQMYLTTDAITKLTADETHFSVLGS